VCSPRPPPPNHLPVCDPVLGDEGKLYVSGELLEAYKNRSGQDTHSTCTRHMNMHPTYTP